MGAAGVAVMNGMAMLPDGGRITLLQVRFERCNALAPARILGLLAACKIVLNTLNLQAAARDGMQLCLGYAEADARLARRLKMQILALPGVLGVEVTLCQRPLESEIVSG